MLAKTTRTKKKKKRNTNNSRWRPKASKSTRTSKTEKKKITNSNMNIWTSKNAKDNKRPKNQEEKDHQLQRGDEDHERWQGPTKRKQRPPKMTTTITTTTTTQENIPKENPSTKPYKQSLNFHPTKENHQTKAREANPKINENEAYYDHHH